MKRDAARLRSEGLRAFGVLMEERGVSRAVDRLDVTRVGTERLIVQATYLPGFTNEN